MLKSQHACDSAGVAPSCTTAAPQPPIVEEEEVAVVGGSGCSGAQARVSASQTN
ncbi:hypothetical protein PC129_g16367 [Phytophthora cactorum]|nr:hypothetical protein PC129_g16367 [Phytophthora cactorum]KAG4233414.1 hypothetical protein PC116_g18383 [Phytophthora cactorum]